VSDEKPGLVKAEPAQLATTGDPFVDFLWRAARDDDRSRAQ
jgi:hypothetical protein